MRRRNVEEEEESGWMERISVIMLGAKKNETIMKLRIDEFKGVQ